MLAVTLRNLLGHKLRLLLTAFAIVIGVAFVSGALTFTHAMGGAFDDIIQGSTADVEIGYKGANDFNSVQDNRTIPVSVVHALENVPGVKAVYPTASVQSLYVLGKNGKLVGGNGPPGFGFNVNGATAMTGKPITQLTQGRLPQAPYEVALDVDTARKGDYQVGDTVKLVTPGDPPTMTVKLVGLVEFGNGGLNGATLTLFDRSFIQQAFFHGKDVYNGISLAADDGVSRTALAAAAQKVLPAGVVARTGDAVVKKNKASLDQILGFINTFLLVFALVALVVGVFLIINTFSILVAQRSRELALLRALGASRRQVNRSVLIEAFVVGVVGSTFGLGAGYLLALGLKALFATFGLDLSRADFPLPLSAIVASYAVGVVVTLLAAYIPARRASRVPPVAALRDDVAMPESSLRRRTIIAGVLVVLGVVGIVAGFAGSGRNGLTLIGLGMLLVLIGAALASPVIGRPVIRLFEVGYAKAFGMVGRLAAQNALRNPRRTAATASALMIGLALVATMSVAGASIKASTDAAVNHSLTSQFIVSNAIGTPFSTAIADEIRRVHGVASVAELETAGAKVNGKGAFVGAIDPTVFAFAMAVPMSSGSLAALGPGKVAIDKPTADGLGVTVGNTVDMKFQGGTVPLQVVAIFGTDSALFASYLVTPDTFVKGGLEPLDSMVFVAKAPSASAKDVRAAIEKITKDLPTVTVKDPAGYADEQKNQVNQFLYLVYGLLALSVVIAVLGIVNTLALSVIERTREVGLLRAVGLSRRQLRTMIRLEAVVIAVLGAVLGIVIGLGFGIGLIRALRDQGLTNLSIPWVGLVLFLVAAALVGVLAAVFPARRAARLDVLRAIATE